MVLLVKHLFDMGYSTELKNELMPEHPLPLYAQASTAPVQLQDEILIVRKSPSKLRGLFDQRRVNQFRSLKKIPKSFPISDLTDATDRFAGKVKCSQAYHCVQMADDFRVNFWP